MKALEKYSKEDLTIAEIVQTVKGTMYKKADDKSIAEAEQNVKIQKAKNKKTRAKIKSLKSALNAKKKYNYIARVGLINQIEAEEENIKSVWHLQNKVKYLKGKDFEFVINDSFNNPYKIKKSEILKMQDNSFFIDKLRDGVEKAIEKLRKSHDLKRDEKIAILQDKLIHVIDFNKQIDRSGSKEIKSLTRKEKDMFKKAYDTSIPRDEKKNKYPILATVSKDSINII